MDSCQDKSINKPVNFVLTCLTRNQFEIIWFIIRVKTDQDGSTYFDTNLFNQ